MYLQLANPNEPIYVKVQSLKIQVLRTLPSKYLFVINVVEMENSEYFRRLHR